MSDESATSSIPAKSARWGRLGVLISLAFSAGTGLAWLLEWNGFQSFPGTLAARTTVITTDRVARVHEISVKTGQAVVPGDLLLQLVDVQLEDKLISKRREIAELETEIVRSRATAEVELAWRRRELQSEIFQTRLKEASLSQEKLNKQVEQIAWKEQLSNVDASINSTLSAVDHPFRSIYLDVHQPDERRLQAMLREDAAAAAAETLATQISLCEQQLKKLDELGQALEIRIRTSSGVDLAETRLTGAKQELASLQSKFQELTMNSPVYGTVAELKLQSGDQVPHGTSIIEILDESQPHVIAQFPVSSVTHLKHGSKVVLIFPANQQRIGIVTSIPPQTSLNISGSESQLAVKVEPAGKLWPKLPVGSQVKVMLP